MENLQEPTSSRDDLLGQLVDARVRLANMEREYLAIANDRGRVQMDKSDAQCDARDTAIERDEWKRRAEAAEAKLEAAIKDILDREGQWGAQLAAAQGTEARVAETMEVPREKSPAGPKLNQSNDLGSDGDAEPAGVSETPSRDVDAEIAQLKAQLAAARKDTARVEYHEKAMGCEPMQVVDPVRGCYRWRYFGTLYDTWREAIDAARQKGGE